MGLGSACLLSALVVGKCTSEGLEAEGAPPITQVARARPMLDDETNAAAGEQPAAQRGDHHSVQEGASLAPEVAEAMRRRLDAAAQVISVLPAGRGPLRQGGALAGAAPTLPPHLEAQRQVALSNWKRSAQELLSNCVARPSKPRQPVALEVAFAPRPQAQGDNQQVLMPDWILVPPHELQRLWQDTDPDTLQECLERARGLGLTVPLPGGAPAQDFPMFVESVLIQL
jgi:hypothetical protein